MNISPLSLTLERFKSFTKEQTFHFPRTPGLYLMLGKNEVEPRLAGNGAGKSTIWDALTWLLYERTPAGLKAGDVCSWEEKKGTRVAFDFIADGDERCTWTCTRTWGPNAWKLSHIAEYVTDEEVVDLAKDPANPMLAALRVAFDAWLCTVVMAQGQDYFLDMPKARQAALFGSVMELDEWERRSERASKAASEEDATLRSVEGALRQIEGKLAATEANNSQDMADEWDDKQRERLDRLQDDHAHQCDRRRHVKDALEQATAGETQAREGLGTPTSNKALDDEYDLVRANVRKHQDKLLKLEVEKNTLKSHAEQLGKSGDCPVCGKPFSSHDWQEEVKRTERALDGIAAEATNIKHTLDICINRRSVLEKEIHAQEDAVQERKDRLREAEIKAHLARNDLLNIDRELDGMERHYENMKREVNPFLQAIERAKKTAQGLRNDRDRLQREVDDRTAQHSIKSMWVRGFKDIRLREIASALSELEVEVNSAVMALGLDDWELRFDVDRETKSGTVQKGFNVTVLSPNATERAAPWEAWSGGEKQRLRIAGNAGLSDMVRARTGCAFPLEVWDEPTNGLSPEGKTDLFRYLSERARVEERVIFLLDHQAHDFGGFTGTCTVIKTPSGSRIRTSWRTPV